jgi:hypothetical protein
LVAVKHREFAKTEGVAKYRDIVRFVSGFEVKNLRAVEGLSDQGASSSPGTRLSGRFDIES